MAVAAMIGAARNKETFFQLEEEPDAWCSTASRCFLNSAAFAGSATNAGLSKFGFVDWNLLPMVLACLRVVLYMLTTMRCIWMVQEGIRAGK